MPKNKDESWLTLAPKEKAAAIKAKMAATLARHKTEKAKRLTAAKRRDLDKAISARRFPPKNFSR